MNRLLWILLFVSTSVLWAWDMDESMVNGSLVKLDSVRCPTLAKSPGMLKLLGMNANLVHFM